MDTLQPILAYILARLKEPTTYVGAVVGLEGVLHFNASDTFNQALVGVLVAIGGLIGVVVSEKGGKK